MRKFFAIAAMLLCLVACKKEGNDNGNDKGYTADDLGSTSWQGMLKIETTTEVEAVEDCVLQLWEGGTADLSYTYSFMSKAMFIDMVKLTGTWSLKKGNLALRFNEAESGNIKDLPWNLTGVFLDEPAEEYQRMTLEIPDFGSVILKRYKLIKLPEV